MKWQQHAGKNTAAALNQPAQKDAAHQRGNALCQIQVQQRKKQGRGKNRHAAAAGAHNALQRPAEINFLQHSGHYTQTEITNEQIQATGGQRGAAGGNAQPTGQQPAEEVARAASPKNTTRQNAGLQGRAAECADPAFAAGWRAAATTAAAQ